eukprot:IDg23608t1
MKIVIDRPDRTREEVSIDRVEPAPPPKDDHNAPNPQLQYTSKQNPLEGGEEDPTEAPTLYIVDKIGSIAKIRFTIGRQVRPQGGRYQNTLSEKVRSKKMQNGHFIIAGNVSSNLKEDTIKDPNTFFFAKNWIQADIKAISTRTSFTTSEKIHGVDEIPFIALQKSMAIRYDPTISRRAQAEVTKVEKATPDSRHDEHRSSITC